MSSKNNSGFTFRGNTTQVLKQVWGEIKENGTEYKSQKGSVKSLKAVTLIIEDPLNDSKNYPYWDKSSDNWYQESFVRKESNLPPENIVKNDLIFPYKYAWRSRYYDLGYGYIKGVIQHLQKSGVKKLDIKIKPQLTSLLMDTYKKLHPEIILAVIAWKKIKLLNFYLQNPQILDEELSSNRVDTLETIINELKHSPSSRRAVIPSFVYPNIDHQGEAGGVPVYQNYQLYINFDSNGNPKSLTSFHLHRAFDAYGGLQLDINHDKEWGILASKKLGLPLLKMVIYGNDVWAINDKSSAPKDMAEKTNIRSWLLEVTNAYDPKIEDIEKRIRNLDMKIKHTFNLL